MTTLRRVLFYSHCFNANAIALCVITIGLCLFENLPASAADRSKTEDLQAHSIAEQFHALVTRAALQSDSGEYLKAEQLLKEALSLAQAVNDRAMTAVALGELGNIYIALGPPQTALKTLIQAEAMGRELNNPALTASVLINLGNFHTFEGNQEKAIAAYEEAIGQALKAGAMILAAQAQANAARIAVDSGAMKQVNSRLKQALASVSQLPESNEKHYLLINLASSYIRLQRNNPKAKNYRLKAYRLLSDVNEAFDKSRNIRGASYALGLMGQLYENDNRYPEALELTQRAIFKSQQLNDKYLIYRWLWQKARVYKAMKKAEAALDAYRDSVALLNTLRYRMSVSYQTPGSLFQESVLPVYSEFIDLLLRNADTAPDADSQNKLLVEVRDTVEQLKVAEIRDYFRDECVDALQAKKKPLWKASSTALIIYPILLADRTELLLDFPDGTMKRRVVPVSLSELSRQVAELRKFLEKRTTHEYRTPAKKLYHWLIEPIKQELATSDIDTLVFVPDGALLTIPMAALYDGEMHLIEQYAIAITPGIQLTDPKPLAAGGIKPLLGGLSHSVEGFPALAYVEEELQSIHQQFGGELLLNKQFHPGQIEQSLNDRQLNVVHISTHGFLGSTIDESFLLTFDGRLSINQLADYVGLFKFRETPLELLVLSACETAQGDERAALGLSGIAVRAGARSALGTLWKVNDVAASRLMQEFYRQFEQAGISRAVALQKAQLNLHSDLRYSHPGYWAAFLLINNWL